MAAGSTPQAAVIPERTLRFSPTDSNPSVTLSPVTSVPQCSADGALFLDMLDPKDLSKHSVISIAGKKTVTFLPSAIADLHDLFVFGFFPGESTVAFLVRGTKETTSSKGSDHSPAGYPWSSYHTYIAQFKRDGSFESSIEIPVSYRVLHLAILPSGEFLVSGYDDRNSAAKLLLLDSAGRVLRTVDTPQARLKTGVDSPFRSVESEKAARDLVGSISFTSYNRDVLVWRRNQPDAILDIGAGGSMREVPLQTPPGYAFVEMIPAQGRWVAHYRRQSTPQDAPFTPETYSYFELRPQDASPSAKIVIPPGQPQILACEANGEYVAYKMNDAGKMVLLTAN